MFHLPMRVRDKKNKFLFFIPILILKKNLVKIHKKLEFLS